MVYSGAWGKLIHEKNQKSKISWHCPFKVVVPARQAAQPGGIGALELILELLKSLKIPPLYSVRQHRVFLCLFLFYFIHIVRPT